MPLMITQPTKQRQKRPFPSHIIVFLVPATVVYTLFMVYPLADTLWLSLFNQAPDGGRLRV